MLVIISAPHFVAGVVFKNGVIERIAPIIYWMKKMSFNAISDYCVKKGWMYTRILDDAHL